MYCNPAAWLSSTRTVSGKGFPIATSKHANKHRQHLARSQLGLVPRPPAHALHPVKTPATVLRARADTHILSLVPLCSPTLPSTPTALLSSSGGILWRCFAAALAASVPRYSGRPLTLHTIIISGLMHLGRTPAPAVRNRRRRPGPLERPFELLCWARAVHPLLIAARLVRPARSFLQLAG